MTEPCRPNTVNSHDPNTQNCLTPLLAPGCPGLPKTRASLPDPLPEMIYTKTGATFYEEYAHALRDNGAISVATASADRRPPDCLLPDTVQVSSPAGLINCPRS
jgi:hypothetical protein